MIHGFGVNSDNWRAIYPELSKNYRVIGLDLLGYGKSFKPKDVDMSIDLWTQQVEEFCKEKVKGDYALVGNSIGSLISVTAASR